jgi:phosphonate transport system substrate-binding protein
MRKTVVLALIGVLALSVLGAAKGALGAQDNPIQMLLVPSTQGEAIKQIGDQIAEALYGLTGLYIDAVLQPDYAAMVESFATSEGNMFGMPTSAQYLAIYERTNGNCAIRLCSVRYGLLYYYAAIYARRDSGIMSFADCDGKIWAATDQISGSGYIIPKAVFDGWGIQPSQTIMTGSHANAITAVVNGQADFATCYYTAPVAPTGMTATWQYGDDPERWIYDDYNNAPYAVDVRGKLNDVRSSIVSAFNVESLISDFKVVQLIGESIPNDGVCFGPDFPTDVADVIVNAIKTHIASDAGKALWSSKTFYAWNTVADVTDSFYDPLRVVMNIAIPTR